MVVAKTRAISATLASAVAGKRQPTDRVVFEDGQFYTVNKPLFEFWRDTPGARLSGWKETNTDA